MSLFLAFLLLVAVIFNYLQYSINKDLEDKNLLLEDEFAAEKADYDFNFKKLQEINKELSLNVDHYKDGTLFLESEIRFKNEYISKLEQESLKTQRLGIIKTNESGTKEELNKLQSLIDNKGEKPKTIKRQPRNK